MNAYEQAYRQGMEALSKLVDLELEGKRLTKAAEILQRERDWGLDREQS